MSDIIYIFPSCECLTNLLVLILFFNIMLSVIRAIRIWRISERLSRIISFTKSSYVVENDLYILNVEDRSSILLSAYLQRVKKMYESGDRTMNDTNIEVEE